MSYTNPDIGNAIASIGALSVLIALVGIAASILYLGQYVGMAVMFIKARQKPWKAIIPVYNVFTLYKVGWSVKGFILSLIAGAIFLIGYVLTLSATLSTIASGSNEIGALGIYGLISLVGAIATLIVTIIFYVKLSKAYGKGGGFAVGLLFLYPIFIMILGFGKARYVRQENKPAPTAVPPVPPAPIEEIVPEAPAEETPIKHSFPTESEFVDESLIKEESFDVLPDEPEVTFENSVPVTPVEEVTLEDVPPMPIEEVPITSAPQDSYPGIEYKDVNFDVTWTPEEEKAMIAAAFGDDSIPVPGVDVLENMDKDLNEMMFETPQNPVPSFEDTSRRHLNEMSHINSLYEDEITIPKPSTPQGAATGPAAAPIPSWVEQQSDEYAKAEEVLRRRNAAHLEAKDPNYSFSSQLPAANENAEQAIAETKASARKSFHDELKASILDR